MNKDPNSRRSRRKRWSQDGLHKVLDQVVAEQQHQSASIDTGHEQPEQDQPRNVPNEEVQAIGEQALDQQAEVIENPDA